MAMDFDGIDDIVELGKFDVVGQITLAAWVKADDFEINDARVISKANEGGEILKQLNVPLNFALSNLELSLCLKLAHSTELRTGFDWVCFSGA